MATVTGGTAGPAPTRPVASLVEPNLMPAPAPTPSGTPTAVLVTLESTQGIRLATVIGPGHTATVAGFVLR